MRLVFILIFSCVLFAQDYDTNLLNLKPGNKYQKAVLSKLNPVSNYYGKNIMQMVFTRQDTLRNDNILSIATWKRFITFRRADSIITKVIDKWTGEHIQQ